ncbi:MAG: polyprenyl synthetase family protein [Synergistaceae bacterium]|jgi:geranylgeranyl diphosphate synthase type I|nr:polyprenyl synthetase family protein [Synergistaceae bacterium]
MIDEYVDGVKGQLNAFVSDLLAREPHVPELNCLYEVFRSASRGGKCLRGALVRLGCETASGCQADDRILPVAAAFEVFQTGILAHDDVIDRSALRRGRDSVWKAAAKTGDGDQHYGVSQAICLGDVAIVTADRLIAQSGYPAEAKLLALSMFHEAVLNTLDGEMLDVLFSWEGLADPRRYDEESALLIARLKTAWYTVAGPLRVGAALAGASAPLLSAMRDFGVALGVAFQIRDDVLGVTADDSATGKSGTDVDEGKVTLLIAHALAHASEDDRAFLEAKYGHPPISPDERRRVVEIFGSTGAFEASERCGKGYHDEALSVIPRITAAVGVRGRGEQTAALLRELCALMWA